MSAIPAWKGVGAKARMHHRQCRFQQWILQIRKILRQLLSQQHAFVHQRLVGQAGDVPIFGAINGRGANLTVGALAHDIQEPLESQVVDELRVAADEHLTDERFAR